MTFLVIKESGANAPPLDKVLPLYNFYLFAISYSSLEIPMMSHASSIGRFIFLQSASTASAFPSAYASRWSNFRCSFSLYSVNSTFPTSLLCLIKNSWIFIFYIQKSLLFLQLHTSGKTIRRILSDKNFKSTFFYYIFHLVVIIS